MAIIIMHKVIPLEERKLDKTQPRAAEVQGPIHGEEGTGYEGPAGKGEFECCNCSFFEEDSVSCGQETMMKLSKRPKLPSGRIVVHPEGCCEFVDRVGSDEADDD